jgi:GNAT superfamily N-acetyltransferase
LPESDLTLRPWRDEDEAGMLALQKEVLGDRGILDPAIFDWQYRRNPEGRAVIFCCEDPEGRIAAQYAVIPIPLRVKGTRIAGSLSLNTATHPNYRHRGLFTETAMAVYEELEQRGVAYTLGFPNENSYPGFVRKLGFSDLGRPTFLVYIFDPIGFIAGKDVADKWPKLTTLVSKLTNKLRRKRNTPVRTHELLTFEQSRMQDLWEPAHVIVAADAKWLAWRYIENPIADYKIIAAGDVKDLDGLVVLKESVQTWRGRIGYIMEFMLKREARLEVAQALIGRAIADFEADGCTAVCFLASPGSRKVNLLKRCGFWEVPRRFNRVPPLILRKHAAHECDILLRDVDVSFGMFDTL